MRSRALVQALATAAVAAVGGCHFDAPGYDGTRYACAPPDDRCPAGYACVDGFCSRGEEAPDVDAAVDASIDTMPPSNVETIPVAVAFDTSILSDAPASNGAALEFLEMDAAPRRVALVQFDLTSITTAAPVVAAELHVTIHDPLESGTFQLFPLTESWTEDGATWDEREAGVPWSGGLSVPTLDADAMLGEFAPRAVGPASVALDAAQVQGWITAPASNYGIAIVSTSPDGRGGRMRSSEYAVAPVERPYLLVFVASP